VCHYLIVYGNMLALRSYGPDFMLWLMLEGESILSYPGKPHVYNMAASDHKEVVAVVLSQSISIGVIPSTTYHLFD
jgi:hypothetical protein